MFSRITGFLKTGLLAVFAWFSFRSGKQSVQVKQYRKEAKQQAKLKEVISNAKEIDNAVDQLDDNDVNQRLQRERWFRD